ERVLNAAAGELADRFHGVVRRRIDDVCSAEVTRHLQFRFDRVDGDNHPRPADAGTLDSTEPDAAAAEHGHRATGLDLRRIQHCADACSYAAADQREAVEGDIITHLHHSVLVDKHLFGKARQLCKLANRRPVPRKSRLLPGTATQFGVAAKIWAAAKAHFTVPTKHRKTADHVVAGLYIGDLIADRLHDTRGLVAEDRRRWHRVKAIDKVQVTVANPGGDRPHEHFMGERLVDVDRFNGEWLMGTVEHCSFQGVLLLLTLRAG